MRYTIIYSYQAREDILSVYDVIAYDYLAPLTAKRYLKGIYQTIESLSRTPQIYAVYRRKSVRQYGSSVRRVNYRKIAIVYTLHRDTVYIHRIVPAGSIAGL